MGFYDAKGYWRSDGDGFYDAKGHWVSPGGVFYDSKGYLRRPGDGFYDAKGHWVSPGGAFYDGKGYLRSGNSASSTSDTSNGIVATMSTSCSETAVRLTMFRGKHLQSGRSVSFRAAAITEKLRATSMPAASPEL